MLGLSAAPPCEIPSMTARHLLRTLPLAAALAVGALVALSVAGTAAGATPCGKKVLADWFDNGRVDRLYPENCYEEAIDAIPEDLKPYADAEDVITRALQAALNGKLARGGKDPSKNPTAPKGSKNGTNKRGTAESTSAQTAPGVDTSGPSSVPIPLIVLGGMSLALLAAGGLGYLSRRRHAPQADDSGDDDALL